MQIASKKLPDDVALLKSVIASQIQALKSRDEELTKKNEKIENLEALLRLARHQRFASSSEQNPNQPSLFDEAEDLEAQGPTDGDNEEEIEITFKRKKKPKRSPIPDSIPREELHYDLNEDEKSCPCCGDQLTAMGEVTSEQLDIIPAQVRALKHIRKKYACNGCKQTVRTAGLPPQPIPKSLASAGLLATICVNKYADGLPLYRQESILKRAGIELGRATVAGWMIKLGNLFDPLYNISQDDLLERELIQMDETRVKVLKEPGKKPQKQSQMWVMASGRFGHDPPIILFHYADSRKSQVPVELLGNWQGYLVTDDYAGYDRVVAQNGIKHCACMDHVRRRFKNAIKSRKKGKPTGLAEEALWYISLLYKVEERVKYLSARRRLIVRNLYSRSILTHLKSWLDRVLPQVRPSSLTGQALSYMAHEWPKLLRILEDGNVPLSNELCENSIRPFVIGRKAWLFSASQSGARASSILYSMIATAKANGHEPYAYLRYVIKRLPSCQNLEDFESLLPYVLSPDLCQADLKNL